MNRHIACVNRSMAAYRSKVQDPVASRNELLARYGFTGKPMVYIRHGTEDKIWLGEPFDQMLDDRNRLRQEHHKAPIFELIQFGPGEFRAGSLKLFDRERGIRHVADAGGRLHALCVRLFGVSQGLAVGSLGPAFLEAVGPLLSRLLLKVGGRVCVTAQVRRSHFSRARPLGSRQLERSRPSRPFPSRPFRAAARRSASVSCITSTEIARTIEPPLPLAGGLFSDWRTISGRARGAATSPTAATLGVFRQDRTA